MEGPVHEIHRTDDVAGLHGISADGQTPANSYKVVNLVSDVAGAAPGLSNPNSSFWISDHGSSSPGLRGHGRSRRNCREDRCRTAAIPPYPQVLRHSISGT